MAGVTCARALKNAGVRVVVVEARARIGGRIHTLRDFCGAPVEAGAEFVHGTMAKTWPDLSAAGLSLRASPHVRGAMINIGYGAQWLPRALLHPQTWPAFTVLRRLAALRPPDMSAREFLESGGYHGRARALAEMVFTSHLPGNLDEIGVLGMIADGALRLETGTDYRVVDGYDRLIEHIADELEIELGFTVNAVEWAQQKVIIRAADGRERSARAAVSTLPAGVLQSGLVRFVPEISEEKRRALDQIVSGPVLKMLMLFEEHWWPTRLSALLCGVGPATLYWNVFFGKARPLPLLTAYVTGPRAAALGRMNEEEALACILNDLCANFPKAKPRLAAWRCVDWSRDPLACGGYSFLRPGAVGARSRLAQADTGALFWAGSETATQPIAATVEGAFTSGLRAAQDVLRVLHG